MKIEQGKTPAPSNASQASLKFCPEQTRICTISEISSYTPLEKTARFVAICSQMDSNIYDSRNLGFQKHDAVYGGGDDEKLRRLIEVGFAGTQVSKDRLLEQVFKRYGFRKGQLPYMSLASELGLFPRDGLTGVFEDRGAMEYEREELTTTIPLAMKEMENMEFIDRARLTAGFLRQIQEFNERYSVPYTDPEDLEAAKYREVALSEYYRILFDEKKMAVIRKRHSDLNRLMQSIYS